MKSFRMMALTIAVGWTAGIAASGPALAIDYKACIAKCREDSCRERCEIQVNRENEERTEEGILRGPLESEAQRLHVRPLLEIAVGHAPARERDESTLFLGA